MRGYDDGDHYYCKRAWEPYFEREREKKRIERESAGKYVPRHLREKGNESVKALVPPLAAERRTECREARERVGERAPRGGSQFCVYLIKFGISSYKNGRR